MHSQNAALTISKATANSTPSRITPLNVMQTRRRITQNYLVIWVDGNIDSNNEDCQSTLELLRTVVSDINICTTPEQCVQFLNDLDDGKAFIISSGALGQHLVHNIHSMAQADAIYIFCGNKTAISNGQKNGQRFEAFLPQ
ncbi:unnamed protein product [Rotaria magnacalcarata]|uniref:Uncharacterized protein n=1 Tax=Rotaria magnacalcarata TaxID=392030 RepID=A0A816EU05_9BILA|nr:unnamed protein product [Rotaria magnacalcarata]CAF1650952.1 unnamed protein product [Rotaria magnacalcarata]CAF2118795.1 unnamed protein product [Rotaria magnacalcarata]CAF4104066.1 unnamed protein product [Rotaria magnacalcarata]CAF4112821.1 unnamed protein product [Rotaria magnacalcarata]